MENQQPLENGKADEIITQTLIPPEDASSAAKPRKPARKPPKCAVPDAANPDPAEGEAPDPLRKSIDEAIRKFEENHLALESRLAIERKTTDERVEFRFNKMEAYQRELISETRRAARDVRAFSAIAVLASIAVIVIMLIK